MGLVDTSVWLRFLSNREPFASELDRLLALDAVAGHDLVYGELLIGDRGGRRALLTELSRMPQAKTVRHAEVVAFVRHCDLFGRGAGWIDAHLLASARVEGLKLWTAESRLAALASDLGIAYTGS